MKKSLKYLILTCGAMHSVGAYAFTGAVYGAQPSYVDGFALNGFVRSFYFYNEYNGAENQRAFALGGILNIKSPTVFKYLSAGISFFTAHNFGVYNQSDNSYDPLLMGEKNSINSLGQAYVEFRVPKRIVIRAGDQMLHDMPWMHSHDPMLLPDSYQAIFAKYTPNKQLSLYAVREFRWQSRTSNAYYNDNYYYPVTYNGDTLYGTFGKLPNIAPQTPGTLALGAKYKNKYLNSEAWYYDFYKIAKMYYLSAYLSKNIGHIKPNIGAQFVREYGSKSLLGNVNSVTYGVTSGLQFNNAQLKVSYNENEPKPGAFLNGGVVSPYNIGALYTNSIIVGLVQLGAGNAWQVAGSYTFSPQVNTNASYAQYHTYIGKSTELDWTIQYNGVNLLKNFSITNELSFDTGGGAPEGKDAYYEQLDLQYLF